MSDPSTLVNKLWSYCQVLRDDGLSYGDYLEQKLVRQYKISLTGNLASEQWPWPKADIRKVFVICEREIDAALGLTLTYAVTSFKTQVGLLVEGR